MLTVLEPPFVRRDRRARRAQREALARVLWTDDGRRRLPPSRALVAAIAACHPRDVWWVCEASSPGPVYLLPTREWMDVLVATIEGWGARSVLEVGAGDGFLSACLARRRPRWRVHATDSGAWRRVDARQEADSPYRGLAFAGLTPGAHVERLDARRAVERYRPDLVVVSWPPPGRMVEHAIVGPSRLVLELGVDGDVCGDTRRTWRYEKDFVDGPLEDRALCRLDSGDCRARKTRATLYYGARHPRHARG